MPAILVAMLNRNELRRHCVQIPSTLKRASVGGRPSVVSRTLTTFSEVLRNHDFYPLQEQG